MSERTGMSDAEFAAFQHNLVRFRRELGEAMGLGRSITQEELSELSGQRVDTVRAYEVGRRRPGLGAMMALARAFGRTVEQMLMTDPGPPDPSRTRAFNIRFKILGTPPPGFQEDLARFLAKYTPEEAQERARLKREADVKRTAATKHSPTGKQRKK